MKSSQNVIFRRHPQLPGIEVCRVVDSGHAFPNHTHEGIFAIGLMAAGGSFCLGPRRKDAFVAPGCIALINPGQVHSGVPLAGRTASYRMIYIDIAQVAGMVSDICESAGTVPEFESMVVHDPPSYDRLTAFCRGLEAGAAPMPLESALLESLARLVTGHAGCRPASMACAADQPFIREAKALLARDLDDRVTLEAAANRLGLSRYGFLRAFKRATGLPPHTYRTVRRIERAKLRLRQGAPVVQVALETGFADQSHFTNKFRQYIGATPSQYRA